MSRLSAGTILAGIMAVLFGLLGAYVVRKQLLNPPVAAKPEEKKAELATIPLAAADIPAGRKITLGDIAILRLTPEQVKKRGFHQGLHEPDVPDHRPSAQGRPKGRDHFQP
jgi:Flp pilus assembly protein CpaB